MYHQFPDRASENFDKWRALHLCQSCCPGSPGVIIVNMIIANCFDWKKCWVISTVIKHTLHFVPEHYRPWVHIGWFVILIPLSLIFLAVTHDYLWESINISLQWQICCLVNCENMMNWKIPVQCFTISFSNLMCATIWVHWGEGGWSKLNKAHW